MKNFIGKIKRIFDKKFMKYSIYRGTGQFMYYCDIIELSFKRNISLQTGI